MGQDFQPTFEALRAVALRHADGLDVTRDAPGDLVVRTRALDGKGQPGWFATVTVKKSYVAFHLPPLYERPDLAESLSEPLMKRRQGKTCFNLKSPDPALIEELEALTARVRGAVEGR